MSGSTCKEDRASVAQTHGWHARTLTPKSPPPHGFRERIQMLGRLRQMATSWRKVKKTYHSLELQVIPCGWSPDWRESAAKRGWAQTGTRSWERFHTMCGQKICRRLAREFSCPFPPTNSTKQSLSQWGEEFSSYRIHPSGPDPRSEGLVTNTACRVAPWSTNKK